MGKGVGGEVKREPGIEVNLCFHIHVRFVHPLTSTPCDNGSGWLTVTIGKAN